MAYHSFIRNCFLLKVKASSLSVCVRDIRGMYTRWPIAVLVIICASITLGSNCVIINLVPLHKPAV
ncbi:hypothetical protein HanIR_Chr05g0230881 [Helianthus annuus]|nr:hypothetical protein HanIR_Chr05g0230881 [Helianthus annuus]